MKFKEKLAVGLATVGAVGAAGGIAAVANNKRLVTSSYTVLCDNLPPSFDGLKLVQLSDLHATSFGGGQKRLIKLLENIDPDLVVITGDLIDRRRTRSEKDMKPPLVLLRELAKRFPTVRVDGNHEVLSPVAAQFRTNADITGVQNVTGRGLKVCRGDEHIVIVGIPDIASVGYDDDLWRRRMHMAAAPYASSFRLTLSHRPQYLIDYAKEGLPLVLCGHAHGGQVRLPLVGGLYAPEQGPLPRYTKGVHTQGTTQMVVSRGLGNSGFPLRFNNFPEIVIINLKCAD